MSRKKAEEVVPEPVTPKPLDTSFDGFCRWVKAIVEDDEKSTYNSSYKDGPSNGWSYFKKTPEKKPCLEVSWETGGVRGGSYHEDSENEDYTCDDPPAELTALDLIIEKLAPDMGFIPYKRMCSKVVEQDSYSNNEYYGNSTNYSVKRVDLKTLYDYFKEKSIL